MEKQSAGRDGASVANRPPQVENPAPEAAPGVPAAAALAVMRRPGPPPLSPRAVLQLQRTIGNRAVGRLLAGTAQRRERTVDAGSDARSSDEAVTQMAEGPTGDARPIDAAAAPGAPPPPVQPKGSASTDTTGTVGSASTAATPVETDASTGAGLPEELRTGVERLSGLSMAGVRVQRESAEPARIGALAFARGEEIHVAPGQERHLPHEAWHVVQQKQGRVPATVQLRGVGANLDSALEREADEMGARAAEAGRQGAAPAEGLAGPAGARAPSADAVIQGVFAKKDIDFIKTMPGSVRIEFLSRVSPADLKAFTDSGFFDSAFGLVEELDQIREARKLVPEPEDGFSAEWLDPLPAGNAREAARELAMLSPPEELDFDVVMRNRDAFMALMRRNVRVAYVEDLDLEDEPDEEEARPSVPSEPVRVVHPESGVAFPAPPSGKSIYFMGYVFARKSDSVKVWTEHLLERVEESGAGPDASFDTIDEEADIDSLIEQMGRLSVSEPKVTIDRTEYDADGDVVMKAVTGSVDVDMADVHGSLDVEMEDVAGYVAMDVEHLRGDFEINVSGVTGYVHITLMDVDLEEEQDVEMATPPVRGRMKIEISEVAGSMEIEIIGTDEAMDVELGPVKADEHVVKRVGKRKQPSTPQPQTGPVAVPGLEVEAEDEDGADEADSPLVKRARKAVPKPSASGRGAADLDLDELIESFEALSISFRAAIDDQVHQIYPQKELADVIVHSNPTPLDTIVKAKKWQNVPIAAGILATLKGLQATCTAALKTFAKARTKGAGTALRKAMKAVAKHLATVGVVDVPATDMTGSTYHGSNAGKTEGTYVLADPLSLNSKQGGHGPSGDGRLMTSIRKAAGTERKSYKQMHLLNDNTFGPGELWNLTPGPAQSNSDMEHNVEHHLKAAILDKGLVIRFEATVQYRNDPVAASDTEIDQDPDKYRFDKITFKAKEYVVDAKKKKYVAGAPQDADVKAIDGAKVDWKWGSLTPLKPKPKILSTTDADELVDAGVPKAAATRIVAYTQAKGAPKLKGGDKKGQLAKLVADWDGKKKFSTSWNAAKVLWS
jgi:hypothetical protein